MSQTLRATAAARALLAVAFAGPAPAQKPGGTLRVQHWDSPASMSIHDEATYSTVVPMTSVMSNLGMFRQDKAQNSLDGIVPEVAESWSWARTARG